MAIVTNRIVMASKFHCDMNTKLVSCLPVSIRVQTVRVSRPNEMRQRREARNLVETQGAGFRWSLFSSDAWFFQMNRLIG